MKIRGLNKESILFFALIIFSVFLLWGDRQGWLDPTRAFFEKPVLAAESRLYSIRFSVSPILDSFSSRKKTSEEIMLLQNRLQQMAFGQSQLNTCLEENAKIRRLLGAPLPPSWHFLPAGVVGMSEKMRLNQGRDLGVEKGMMVVADNILVGRVLEAEKKSALVQTLGDPSVRLPVVIKKPLGAETEIISAGVGIQARGLLQAGSEKGLMVKEILQEEDVQIGDLVLTSGEAGWLPELLIGIVEAVEGREAELYKSALVKPLIDHQDLSIVFVVTDY